MNLHTCVVVGQHPEQLCNSQRGNPSLDLQNIKRLLLLLVQPCIEALFATDTKVIGGFQAYHEE